MAKNLGHLQLMNQAMYKARLETEFRILQQRINPHFLCNTLEIINGMILCGEEENALELTGMLGRMYRYDLGENDIADFREEVEYLKNYLSILSYKYPSLQVFYEIDDSVLPCQIPKFVCQPLVENTLKHGFSGRIDDCRLWIGIRRNREEITIRIQDNGKGIEPELLEDIRLRIEDLRKDQTVMISEHIGLLNTARRLFLFFGDACRFDIQATEGEGTQIDISVKAIEGG
jgi:two-component system sensor histidine kinase YesM